MKKIIEPTCPYCGQKSKKTTGKEVYPFLNYLHSKVFYLCKPCDAYVGCHRGSSNPLGVLANKEHRQLKMSAHRAFDPIWQSGRMLRSDAYQWLADKMGIKKRDCHIGQFSVEDCKRVIEICNEFYNPKAKPAKTILRKAATVATLE